MAGTNASQPSGTRVVQWVGFAPHDTATTESHTVTKADFKRALGPDVDHPDVVFSRDSGFFAEVSDPAVVAFFEDPKTVGFKVKPAQAQP